MGRQADKPTAFFVRVEFEQLGNPTSWKKLLGPFALESTARTQLTRAKIWPPRGWQFASGELLGATGFEVVE